MNAPSTATKDTVCHPELFRFRAVKKRQVGASFSGGDVTSDGGLPLLRQLDRRLGLTKAMAQALPDPRDPALIEHSQHSLLRQRIYGLCHGYEDLNDHDTLRLDPVWQTAVEQIKPLASSPTLCRLENRADRAAAWTLHGILVDQFVASFRTPPTELILDFDATDDRVHGRQEAGRFPLELFRHHARSLQKHERQKSHRCLEDTGRSKAIASRKIGLVPSAFRLPRLWVRYPRVPMPRLQQQCGLGGGFCGFLR